jgi:flagellar biosynthesis protein FlhB
VAEKTHDPTPKRLREARDRGDVVRAPLVAAAVGLLVLPGLIGGALTRVVEGLVVALQSPIAEATAIDPFRIGLAVIAAVAPIALVFIALAVLTAVVTGSLTFSTSRLAPDFSRLEPFGGLANLVDKSKLWNAFRGTVLAVLLAIILGRVVVEAAVRGARSLDTSHAIETAVALTKKVLFIAGGIAATLAVIDVVVARHIWLSRLKMSRDEVTREHKEGDGDPEVKRRREELHHEAMSAEAVSAVRDATVLVINPTHIACALRYDDNDQDDAAPELLAKGHGALAAKMIAEAKLHGVPIVRDIPVARALFELESGSEIPEALYHAVAEVIRAAWDGESDESE